MSTHIFLVIPEMAPGGAERVVATLASIWAENYSKVTLYVLQNHQQRSFYSINREVTVLPESIGGGKAKEGGIRGFYCQIIRLREQIRIGQPDVVVSFLPSANIASILSVFRLGVPVVISERNCMRRRKLGLKWELLRYLLYRLADGIVINLSSNQPILERFVDGSKIRYLVNPVELHRWSRETVRERWIVSVGRLHPQKRHEYAIRAFADSGLHHEGWRFDIVGAGPLKESLLSLITSLGLSEHIHIVDPLPDVWKRYGNATLFIMMSEYEGMPNALIEAISLGLLPIVTPGVGDLASLIESVEPCLVVNSSSATEVGSILRSAALDTGKRESVTESLCLELTDFEREKVAGEWISYLSKIIEEQMSCETAN